MAQTLVCYSLAPDGNGYHTATRTSATAVSNVVKNAVTFTLSDNPANTETLIFGGLTWTFVTSGATGRQVNIAGTAALTAAAFATAFAAHADAATFTVTNPTGADILVTRVADSTTITLGVQGSGSGTADHTTAVSASIGTATAPATTGGLALVIDTTRITDKVELGNALEAIERILSADCQAISLTASLPTTGTLQR